MQSYARSCAQAIEQLLRVSAASRAEFATHEPLSLVEKLNAKSQKVIFGKDLGQLLNQHEPRKNSVQNTQGDWVYLILKEQGLVAVPRYELTDGLRILNTHSTLLRTLESLFPDKKLTVLAAGEFFQSMGLIHTLNNRSGYSGDKNTSLRLAKKIFEENGIYFGAETKFEIWVVEKTDTPHLDAYERVKTFHDSLSDPSLALKRLEMERLFNYLQNILPDPKNPSRVDMSAFLSKFSGKWDKERKDLFSHAGGIVEALNRNDLDWCVRKMLLGWDEPFVQNSIELFCELSGVPMLPDFQLFRAR